MSLESPSQEKSNQQQIADVEGVDLLIKMDIEDISALRMHFFPPGYQFEQLGGLSLTRLEFMTAMDSVAGNSCLSQCAGQLYDTLDIDGSGTLQWEEVLDAIIEKTSTSKDEEKAIPLIANIDLKTMSHTKGESIVKIIPLETDLTFCFVVISKTGRIGIYDGSFNLLDDYKIGLKAEDNKPWDKQDFKDDRLKESLRKSCNTWLTDAVFIIDTYSLLFASSDRSLHLYDGTGLVHVPLCKIEGLPNVPMCLHYHNSKKMSQLLIGDDKGNITIMKFHQSANSLFKKKHPDKLDRFYWVELTSQADYVTYTVFKNVHNGAIKEIMFCSENDTIISCSLDPIKALVVQHVDGKRDPYIFKLQRGVRCFSQDRHLQIIVTGSNDNLVRIWNPVVTIRPITTLCGHKSPVVDVCILQFQSAIFSFDESGELRIWDINDEFCVLRVQIRFPSYQELGKKIEFGAQSIYFEPIQARNDSKDLINHPLKSSFSESGLGDVPRYSNVKLNGKVHVLSRKKKFILILDKSGFKNDGLSCEIVFLNSSNDEKDWKINNIMLTCCNYVALITISNTDETEKIREISIKPPPSGDNVTSISWRKMDRQSTIKSPEGSIKSMSTSESSFVAGNTLYFAGQKMHTKKTQYRIKQDQMKMLIQQNAPHLALDLHDLVTVSFSHPLPDTKAMREKGIDVSNPEQLLRARIHRNSAGELSAMECQSLKSSYKSSNKNLSMQKPGNVLKRKSTPEWFSNRIKILQKNN